MPAPPDRPDALDRLRRFDPFDALTVPALQSLAGSTRWLQVPAGRWLVRPGRTLSETLYLVEGRIRLLDGRHTSVVAGGSRRARRPVYPGAQSLATLTPSRFAAVTGAAMAWARQQAAAGAEPQAPGPRAGAGPLPALPRLTSAQGSWQGRFLGSPLLRQLPPADWQRLLRALVPRQFSAGEYVLRRGEPAGSCYVLQRGQVEVWTAGAAAGEAAGVRPSDPGPAARLDPGALFGEDALVTGRHRNASVIASGPVAAGELEAGLFRRWLLSALPPPLPRAAGRRLISLEPGCSGATYVPLAGLRSAAAELSVHAGYAVTGGQPAERMLAALLLTQRGIDARPLQ